jgi:HSP20 family protein
MTLVKFNNGEGMRSFPAIENALGFPSIFSETLDKFWSDENVNWMPSVNIRERAEDFKIDLAVPGMNKKDFRVEVDNGVVHVSGERKEDDMENNEKLTRREFHYGSFKRSFNLPDTANPEEIHASYKDGILSLTIAKKEESKLKPKRQINID